MVSGVRTVLFAVTPWRWMPRVVSARREPPLPASRLSFWGSTCVIGCGIVAEELHVLRRTFTCPHFVGIHPCGVDAGPRQFSSRITVFSGVMLVLGDLFGEPQSSLMRGAPYCARRSGNAHSTHGCALLLCPDAVLEASVTIRINSSTLL